MLFGFTWETSSSTFWIITIAYLFGPKSFMCMQLNNITDTAAGDVQQYVLVITSNKMIVLEQ